jgi:hypothetical protein
VVDGLMAEQAPPPSPAGKHRSAPSAHMPADPSACVAVWWCGGVAVWLSAQTCKQQGRTRQSVVAMRVAVPLGLVVGLAVPLSVCLALGLSFAVAAAVAAAA